jgi:hypothetical protein
MAAGMAAMTACLAGCGDAGDTRKTPTAADNRSAREVVADMQARIDAWRRQDPAERDKLAPPFGPDLEHALDRVAGTSFENTVAFWLANWRFEYAGGDGVEPCLERINSSQWPAFKHFGKVLRVQLELRHGDLDNAAKDVDELVALMPEYAPLKNQVALHRLVGQPPPMTDGRNLTGGPADPATRPEPWILFVVLDPLNDENLYLLQKTLAEAARPENRSRMRVVCVTGDSNILAVTAKCQALPGSERLDVLWEPAGTDGTNPWRTAWGMSEHETALLLLGPGPKRLIMAVLDGHPEDLRGLLPK